jgi:hypothetical protein
MLSARMVFQDAIAAGLGATEYALLSKAAEEIATLWKWSRSQLAAGERPSRKAAA